MTRIILTGIVAGLLAAPVSAVSSEAGQGAQVQGQGRPQGPRGAQRGAARGQLPNLPTNADAQQLQTWLDAFALVQAERELELTAEQYPTFVARLTRLQNLRRRVLMERRRLMNELRAAVQSPAPARDEAIDEKVRALDEANRRGTDELRKSYLDVDAVLTPWQRGRFRLFEEQLERRKIELLAKVGAGG